MKFMLQPFMEYKFQLSIILTLINNIVEQDNSMS